MKNMIKVVLADDHQIVLDGLKSLLEREKEICPVGEALNGVELLKLLKEKQADVAVVDIDMPLMNGIETTKEIKRLYPEMKVLILSMYNDHEYIRRLIEAGASGYILKNKGKEELVSAIHKIADGGQYLGDAILKVLIDEMQKPVKTLNDKKVPLTKRETDVLKLIVEGNTTPQISDALCIAHSTVETHRRNLIDKLGVANTKELIKQAIKNGYVKFPR
ncbi:MAG TPA: response regulator transcription factor [Prolixibacteraceae bacterium]|nr:response regulator transcription factor [Prolixibacteraceae bacterium]HPS11701.1 response regulator transcription factor [Prolixibacteraceae bacterium]